MLQNIADLKTTIPTIVGLVFTLLGVFGVVEIEEVPALSEAFTGLGLAILTTVGALAKAK